MLYTDKTYWAARAEKRKPGKMICPSRLHRRGVDIDRVWRQTKGPRLGFGPHRPEEPDLHYRQGYRGARNYA